MTANPVLARLGLAEDARVVIIHADDIGMCRASLDAYIDLLAVGGISSASTMVPCAWFPATAQFCRTHPEVDMGVHLTLTSEWDAYRWGPISTREAASGLLDDEGYFHRGNEAAQAADPDAVNVEITAQINCAQEAGIDVTHADTHMGTVGHGSFIPFYVQAALAHQIPAMIPRWHETHFMEARDMDAGSAAQAAAHIEQLAAQGLPLIDHVAAYPLQGVPADPVDQAKADLAALKPGITHYIIHPSLDTPEARAISPDWAARVACYQAFMSSAVREFIQQMDIYVIGYRALRDLMRAHQEGD